MNETGLAHKITDSPNFTGVAQNTILSRPMRFDIICKADDIKHRLTKPNHPWTNGQVERMNRTIKEATVKRFHYESHE